jgi:hypothetical protein
LLGAELGLVVVYGWLAANWAEANPNATKASVATAIKAIMILVFCMCLSPYYHMVMEAYGSWLKQK